MSQCTPKIWLSLLKQWSIGSLTIPLQEYDNNYHVLTLLRQCYGHKVNPSSKRLHFHSHNAREVKANTLTPEYENWKSWRNFAKIFLKSCLDWKIFENCHQRTFLSIVYRKIWKSPLSGEAGLLFQRRAKLGGKFFRVFRVNFGDFSEI